MLNFLNKLMDTHPIDMVKTPDEIQSALDWFKENDKFYFKHNKEFFLKQKFFRCIICGRPETANYIEPTKKTLLEKYICFTCNHWAEMCEGVKTGERFIINGNCYTPCKETGPMAFRGHGGSKFYIKVNAGPKAGQLIASTNLWHKGNVTKWWRDSLQDNAEFLLKEQFELLQNSNN